MKMKQVYESNPALGDPMSIQGQLTDNGQRLDKLRAEQKKYQVIMVNIKNSKSIILVYTLCILVSSKSKLYLSFLGYA
jgi:hypothetical protein